MKSCRPLFAPLQKAFSAFFRQDLSLQRGRGGVRLVLQDRETTAAPRPTPRQEVTARKDDRLLVQAREQLATALDAEPGLRAELRHLAFVEHALGKKGWRALHKVPLSMLQAALEQLEGQVTNWSPEGLAGLRSKMAVAVIDREQDDAEHEAGPHHDESVLDPPELLAARAIETAQATSNDDAALLAAYAAIGNSCAAVEVQAELGAGKARAAGPTAGSPSNPPAGAADIRLLDLEV